MLAKPFIFIFNMFNSFFEAVEEARRLQIRMETKYKNHKYY